MTAQLITTDKLQPGDKVEHRRNGDRFTVDSVTPSSTDWRFQGKNADGTWVSESGMEIVGHDADGETVRFTAAQSCQWWVIELAASVTGVEAAVITLTKTAVTLYDIESNRVWRTMSHRDGEREVQLCYELGDVVQEYDTTDLDGNPVRVVYQIDAPREYAKPDQGGVYVFTR